MPKFVYALLMTMARETPMDGWWTMAAACAAVDYHPSMFKKCIAGIVDRGWISRPVSYGRFQITERGKIAVAIECGRRRRLGRRAETPFRDFKRLNFDQIIDVPQDTAPAAA